MAKPRNYWNYLTCYQEALKYKTRTEFEDNCGSAVSVARKNGWMNDYFWMPVPVLKHIWNYENTYKEAEKYNSRSEFYFGNNSAYNAARKNEWLNDYIWLHDKRFDLFNDKIDMVYSYEFTEQHAVYIGRTLMRTRKQRDYQHIFGDDSVSRFAKQNNISVPEMKILETELTIKEGSENEGIWLLLYQEDGWLILNKTKTGSIGGLGKNHSVWNYNNCYEEAKKYNTKTEFFKVSNRAYEVARRNNWLEEYDWFEDGFKILGDKRRFWTYERCVEESKKYITLKDFRENSKAAYNSSYKNKWLDDFTWLERDRIKRNTFQDYNNCYNEAKKYDSLKEFRKQAPSCYASAISHKWIKDYNWLNRERNKKNPRQLVTGIPL